MAENTSLNSQITDSVIQANTEVLGLAPSMSMGSLFMATSQALSNAAHNATSNQQQMNITAQTASISGIANLYALNTTTTAEAETKIYQ